jgi:hypothetical protein
MAKRYNILTRCMAALALFFVYVVSSSAILVGATTSPAQAWRGGGRGYYRGGGWGRGRGWGYGRGYGYGFGGPIVVAPGPRCWWRYGARVCRW